MPIVDVAAAKVAYRVDGRGPGLLLVHGTAGDSETNWNLTVDRLAERWTVVRPDYSGSGAPEDDGAPLTVAGLARQVVAAAEAAGIVPFHVLGYSLGAVVAVKAAAEHPDKVRSVVPLGGFVSSADSRFQLQMKFWRTLVDRDREALARHWVLTGFSPAFLSRLDSQSLEQIVALNLEGKNWEAIARQIDLDLAIDIGAEAARVAAPALVIGCRQDQMVPPTHARDLAARIPGATYAELDSGHAAPMEAPDALLDLVEPFLQRAG
ncbi:MAG: alpha/beta fold hydrolase [Kiloniellaceae bacterium]|nr:alpha/beta fold hydrolase [Kiloniellaceae bacterium]